jgi:hypothetical protein
MSFLGSEVQIYSKFYFCVCLAPFFWWTDRDVQTPIPIPLSFTRIARLKMMTEGLAIMIVFRLYCFSLDI